MMRVAAEALGWTGDMTMAFYMWLLLVFWLGGAIGYFTACLFHMAHKEPDWTIQAPWLVNKGDVHG
jgi:hypothetical protein